MPAYTGPPPPGRPPWPNTALPGFRADLHVRPTPANLLLPNPVGPQWLSLSLTLVGSLRAMLAADLGGRSAWTAPTRLAACVRLARHQKSDRGHAGLARLGGAAARVTRAAPPGNRQPGAHASPRRISEPYILCAARGWLPSWRGMDGMPRPVPRTRPRLHDGSGRGARWGSGISRRILLRGGEYFMLRGEFGGTSESGSS
jgi:hypothetical protein